MLSELLWCSGRLNLIKITARQRSGRMALSEEAQTKATLSNTIMLRLGDNTYRQRDLFPRGGRRDRAYRTQLKYTKVYNGDLASYDDLVATGGMVALFDGQTRPRTKPALEAMWVTATKDMGSDTKFFYIADSAATVLPPPCSLQAICWFRFRV